MDIDSVIDGVLRKEGGYVNDPADRGGETNWGITIAVARANGWQGPMRQLPRDMARKIYWQQYVRAPGFDLVGQLDAPIGAELVDTGVNMGPVTAARFLQRALNGLNRRGREYADIVVDGDIGPATIRALSEFFIRRGAERRHRLLKLLNALQGARYLDLAEARSANEDFLFGWLERI